MQRTVASPPSVRSKWLLSNIRSNVSASGPVAPPARTRDTCLKKPSIMVERVEVVGLSGVMVHAKDFWRGYFQPRVQFVELRPSWLSPLPIMMLSDAEALTERVSCCAASELLIEKGKGRIEIRAMPLRPKCSYSRLNFGGVLCRGSCDGGFDR